MMAERLFFGLVVLLVFIAGGFDCFAGDGVRVDKLISKLGQADWQYAINALVKIGEPAVEPLIHTLQNRNIKTWVIHTRTANALIKINPETVIKPLIAALKDKDGNVREQAAWVLSQIESNKIAKEVTSPSATSEKISPEKIYCGKKVYSCYPATLETKPDLPSPHTTLDRDEVVTAFTKDGKYALIPVSVENGKPLNYKQNQWGKGRQLEVDAGDFPTLAKTGLHSEAELHRTKMITGRSIVEIIELGRPGRSSGAGFMADDEDIISVIKGDNRLVEILNLRHRQTAKPLFHIWNMILRDVELNRLGRFWEPFEYILYKGKKVFIKAEGTKGWQESLFDDEILGKFQIEIWRELNEDENTFLREKYPNLTENQMSALLKKLSHIHISEMAPFYIMRYGFYEGHTDYRADPIAIAWIFGLRSLEQIETAFDGRLDQVLMRREMTKVD